MQTMSSESALVNQPELRVSFIRSGPVRLEKQQQVEMESVTP